MVRKGQNDEGRHTFYVQAGRARVARAVERLSRRSAPSCSPTTPSSSATSRADFFTRDQLELTRQFVAERGGGLLVVGARSFERQGLSGTPLDEVLPIDLTDRRGTVARASAVDGGLAAEHRRAHLRWRPASGHAPGGGGRREPAAVDGASRAGLGHHGRRAAPGRAGAGGQRRAGRRRAPADCGPALWPGARHGLCRRGVVAVAHADAGHRHQLRDHLAAARALDHRRRTGAGRHCAARAQRRRASPSAWPLPCATTTTSRWGMRRSAWC